MLLSGVPSTEIKDGGQGQADSSRPCEQMGRCVNPELTARGGWDGVAERWQVGRGIGARPGQRGVEGKSDPANNILIPNPAPSDSILRPD